MLYRTADLAPFPGEPQMVQHHIRIEHSLREWQPGGNGNQPCPAAATLKNQPCDLTLTTCKFNNL